MVDRFKTWLGNKFSDTIFGQATETMRNVFSSNKKAFFAEMFLCLIIAGQFSGILGIAWLNIVNLGRAEYSFSFLNINKMWLFRTKLLSVFMFFIVQALVAKGIILFSSTSKKDARGKYDLHKQTPYGDADLMSFADEKKYFNVAKIEDNYGPIFGTDYHHKDLVVCRKDGQLKVNKNVLVVAGPNAGKSATFVIPLLFQIIRSGESAIISDPKSELFAIVSELAKGLGYQVRLLSLNPMFLQNSDPCNFLTYVTDADKAKVVSRAIISNTSDVGNLQDFWTEGAENLLQAIILRICLCDDYPKEKKNLPEVFKYVTTKELMDMKADFHQLPPNHYAVAPWKTFDDGDDKPKAQTMQGLRLKLGLFNSPSLQKVLSSTEGGIDVLDPGRKKCLYFIGSNDQDSSMSSIVSLFYTLEYQELVRYADGKPNRQLPITVNMVLDEYANMAAIPDFEKKLSTVRSRGIVTYIIIQDINQLKTKHPHDTWKTVKNDCDYFVLLKTNDEDTATWFSNMSGEQTKSIKNVSYQKNKTDLLNIHNSEKVSQGVGQGKVLTPKQVMSLKEDELLVQMTMHNMLYLKTFFWKRHPYAKYVGQEVLPAQHYPLWKLKEDGVVPQDYSVEDYDNGPSYIMELPEDNEVDIDKDWDPDAMLGISKGAKNDAKVALKHAFASKKAKDKAKDAKKQFESHKITTVKAGDMDETTETVAPGRSNKFKKKSQEIAPDRTLLECDSKEEVPEKEPINRFLNELRDNLTNVHADFYVDLIKENKVDTVVVSYPDGHIIKKGIPATIKKYNAGDEDQKFEELQKLTNDILEEYTPTTDSVTDDTVDDKNEAEDDVPTMEFEQEEDENGVIDFGDADIF